MARPMRPELAAASVEANRYVRTQWREAERLGYPKMTTFAKDIARGTLALAPTPEDPALEDVGRFLWLCNEIERRVVFEYYAHDGDTLPRRAARCSMTASRMSRLVERVLIGLAAWMKKGH